MSKDRFTFLLDGDVNSFFPGEVVSGQFVAELANPVIVKEVKIRLFGGSYCEFTETIDDSESTYADQETFVNVAKTCLAGESVELPVGQHKYPFSFTIPTGVPSSFETSQAYVRYQITAVFELAGSGGRRLESCIINVVSPFDLNGVRENLMLPAEYTYEKTNCCLCCKSGPITATIKTDRKGYVPGDTILVNTEISNMSNGRIKESTCKLVMRYYLYAGGSQSFYTVGLGEVKHGPIEKGETGVYRNDKIQIPPCPPSQLHGCKIIKISYVIQLTVVPAGLSGPLIVWTNITIGSIPLDGVALRYGVTVPSLSTESYRDDLLKKIPQVSLQDCTFGGVNIYPGEDPFLQTKRIKVEKQFVPKYLYYKWEQRDPIEMFRVV